MTHDGKVVFSSVEYTAAFLFYDWLFFLWHGMKMFHFVGHCSLDYTGIGCYRDTADRAIPTLESTDSVLDGGVLFYQRRENAIVKCAVAARKSSTPLPFKMVDGAQRVLMY